MEYNTLTNTVNASDVDFQGEISANSFDSVEGYKIAGVNILNKNGDNLFIDCIPASGQLVGADNNYITSTLTSLTTGSDNSVYGYGALPSNVTGLSNTAMGSGALLQTTSSCNTGIGAQAGDSITTGQANTFLGYNADSSVATGTNRSSIGYEASNAIDNSCQIGDLNVKTLTLGARTALAVPNSTSMLVGGLQGGTYTGTGNYLLTTTQATNNITSGSNNFIMANSIPSIIGTGLGNILIGRDVGFNAGGIGYAGTYNVMIGDQAAGTGTTRAVGVGVSQCFALGSLTFQNPVGYGGSQCVSIGHTSGNNIHDQTTMTFIGTASRSTYTSGLTNSTAIGANSVIVNSNEVVLGSSAVTKIRPMSNTCDLGDNSGSYSFRDIYLNRSLIFKDASNSIGDTNYGCAKFYTQQTSDGMTGSIILVGGTLVVPNTTVTNSAKIFLQVKLPGGTVGTYMYVSAITAGQDFTITSENAADTSTVEYLIML